MYNKYDGKRLESFQKLLGKGDAKKNISVNLREDMIERLDDLARRASKMSGNNITRNAIIEEGISIYVEEFEAYINRMYATYEDSGKYIEDSKKLPNKKGKTELLETKKDETIDK